jgi:hypothetical protein
MPTRYIKATAQEIENFVREFLPFVILSKTEDEYGTALQLNSQLERGRLWWGTVTIIEKTQGTFFTIGLERENISSYCKDNIEQQIDLKTGYTSQIDRLHAEIRERFKEKPKPEEPKHKGRYRLTPDEIKFRNNKVKEAQKIKDKHPEKYWKQIALEIDVPERTLREWRHDWRQRPKKNKAAKNGGA